jgi:putative ABC transport system permease protein
MALLLDRWTYIGLPMLKNYFTTALRNLRKNSVFTFINLMGLSLGMAAFILIFQYISFEKSVNGFHANLPNIYRLITETKNGDIWDDTAPGLAPIGKQQISEIKDYVRLALGTSLGDGVVAIGDSSANAQSFRERNFAYAEGNFFEVFSFELIHGTSSALKEPNTVALSESSAKKYFGKENPIGKVITLNNQFGKTLYTVTLVYADMPQNSDFRFDVVFSLQTLANKANLNGNDDWASLDGLGSQWLKTYLLLQPNANPTSVEEKASAIENKMNPENSDVFKLHPFANQHLATSLRDRTPVTGSLGFIYLLTGIAVLILVIAWFNYINLSTAGSLKRAKEVGIRKVAGASKLQLVRQFLGESLAMNLFAFIIGLALVNLLQGTYNYFIGKNLGFGVFQNDNLWLIGIALILVGSITSGAYTSFALSSFKPSQTLKGIFSKSGEGIWLRKALVVFQFTISILLIACTLILQNQLHFLENKKLGMELNQLLVIQGPEVGRDETFKGRSVGFDQELSQLSFIDSYSRSGGVPIDGYNFSTSGVTKLNPIPGDEKLSYSMITVDYKYFKTYSIGFAAGKDFTEEMGSTRTWAEIDKAIINEKAAHQLGFDSSEEAIGQKIVFDKQQLEVIGVVRDYHHLSLRQPIDPIVFFPRNNGGFYTTKIATQDIATNIATLDKLFKRYFPGNPFDYYFVNDKYNEQYKTEQQYGTLFSIASGLAIFIACLGLFGLATFTVEQRIKEIGVRKVLGASIPQITTLISKEFLTLVIVSILFATPLAWYAMSQWLQSFAYQTEITWWTFGLAGAMAILIALITVSSQAIKAALSNPVESLRSE